MESNPYASYLNGRDPVAILTATPAELQAHARDLTPHAAHQPIAPGKWTFAQIMAHLADGEIVFSFRLRQTLAVPGITLQSFDQTLWGRRYTNVDLPLAMQTFLANRAWNLDLIQSLTPAEWDTPSLHSEYGTMTFRTIIEFIAGHDANHLLRLQQAFAPSQT